MTSRITFTAVDLAERSITRGVKVRAWLVAPSGQRGLPPHVNNTDVVIPAAVEAPFAVPEGEQAGKAELDLIRSSDLPAGYSYTIVVVGARGDEPVNALHTGITIPDGDRTFRQLLGQVTPGRAAP